MWSVVKIADTSVGDRRKVVVVVRTHAAVAGSLTIVFSRWWMTGDTSSTNKCSAEWETLPDQRTLQQRWGPDNRRFSGCWGWEA